MRLLLVAPLVVGAVLEPEMVDATFPTPWPRVPAIAVAQDTQEEERGRVAIDSISFPPLEFDPPEVHEQEIEGVAVLHLHDPTLPLVDVQVLLVGGAARLGRDRFGVASALPALLRTGGTRELPRDSVDRQIDLLALQLSVGAGGGGISVRLNSLTRTLEPGLELLGDMLLEPRFEEAALEVWRGQALERIRRRGDDPGGLAFSEFNRLMYGDHPVGWVLEPEDLATGRLNVEALRTLHRLLVCRDRMIVGVSGDIAWEQAEAMVRSFLVPVPPCTGRLPPPPDPVIRDDPGVFVLTKELDQSTLILAAPGGIRREDSSEYFASRVANHLLGGGGFGSRITARLRTEEGLAYGASSVWTTPNRHEGLVGAFTATRAERTVEAINLLLDTMADFKASPPSGGDVRGAVEEMTSSFVFNFDSPAQIVARRMAQRAEGLPASWLTRFWVGLGEVTPEQVSEVIATHLDVDAMTILLVGDPARFDSGLTDLGPVFELLPDGTYRPWVTP